MLNTHATELIRSTFYPQISYAMLVLSFCQRVSTSSMKLCSIELYGKYNPMKHDMMYQYLHCETFATYKYILVQLRGKFYTSISIYHYFIKLLNTTIMFKY